MQLYAFKDEVSFLLPTLRSRVYQRHYRIAARLQYGDIRGLDKQKECIIINGSTHTDTQTHTWSAETKGIVCSCYPASRRQAGQWVWTEGDFLNKHVLLFMILKANIIFELK